jgi:hypothetical protein
MERKETVLLDFLGSLGAILTTIAAVVFFGQRASSVGKGVLDLLGMVIVILSLPGILPRRRLGQPRSHQLRLENEDVNWWVILEREEDKNAVEVRFQEQLQAGKLEILIDPDAQVEGKVVGILKRKEERSVSFSSPPESRVGVEAR